MKKLHKITGLVMLLPFIAWAVTGMFFFIKPGYQAAYQAISPTLYPIKQIIQLPKQQWLEVRQVRTVLGEHLLVKDENGWQQLSSENFEVIAQPTATQIRQLVNDAIAKDKARYGEIASIEKNVVSTSTGVKITLDWPTMSMRQKGEDTDFINAMYDVHYLRWTGNAAVDKYLGVIGLSLVVLLALLGAWMTLKPLPTRSGNN